MGKGSPDKRVCKECKINKPFSEFSPHPRGADGIRRVCKTCQAKQARQYRNDPAVRAKAAKKAREYRAANPDYAKNYRRKHNLKRYGLTVETFDQLLSSQNGLCAICEQTPVNPHIDHDHETGEVRGILCGNCNTGIGMLKDNSEIVEKAAKYLREHGR